MSSTSRRNALALLGAVATPGKSAFALDDRRSGLLLRNCRVWTAGISQPQADAIVIRNGQIVAVGTEAGMAGLRGPATRVLDLEGRLVIPGVNDAHDHRGSAPPGVAISTNPPPEADAPLSVLADALARAAQSAPKGEWLFAKAGATVMRDPVATISAVESVVADHPVAIMAWWGHGLILNKAGQAWAGISDGSPDPPGGWLDRDAQGRFSGRLNEYAGAAIWRRLSTVVKPEAHVRAFQAYAALRHAQGVTSVQIMTTSQPPLALARTVMAADARLDVRLMQYIIPAEDGVVPLKSRQLGPLARLDGVKYVVDGTPIDQNALQLADYPGRPGWRGRLNFDQGFLKARLREALEGDQQLLLHVVGDATSAIVLNLMQDLAPARTWAPRRVRFEHADGLRGDSILRAREFGLVIAQARLTQPYRDWISAGLKVAYGSDEGFEPWSLFKAMTAESNRNKITRQEALEVLTSAPAWSERREQLKGCIAPGYRADLAILSQDVLSCPHQDLDKTTSVLTLVGGEVVHAA